MFAWTQSVQLIFISKWMSCVWPADTALYFLLQMCSMLIVVFFQTNDPVSFKWCISQKVFESEFSKGVKIAKKLNRKTLAFIFLKCQKLHFLTLFEIDLKGVRGKIIEVDVLKRMKGEMWVKLRFCLSNQKWIRKVFELDI